MNVAWACFGEEAGARNIVLFRVKWLQHLVCEAVAAGAVSDANLFLLPVLLHAVVHVCVLKGCFGICGCRSQ